jgi:hypothetical protein
MGQSHERYRPPSALQHAAGPHLQSVDRPQRRAPIPEHRSLGGGGGDHPLDPERGGRRAQQPKLRGVEHPPIRDGPARGGPEEGDLPWGV